MGGVLQPLTVRNHSVYLLAYLCSVNAHKLANLHAHVLINAFAKGDIQRGASIHRTSGNQRLQPPRLHPRNP